MHTIHIQKSDGSSHQFRLYDGADGEDGADGKNPEFNL
ncbi:MAG: hypothetical protein Q4B28_05015 [bacterium]|nr:hypothetical protein [bacterium]